MPSDRSTSASKGRRVAGCCAVLALALVLASCVPDVRATFEAHGAATVTAEDRGTLLTVRIPDSRPRDGVQVRRDEGPDVHIPPGHYPPPGQCRVWHPERPPGQQGPPGDCHRLERELPPGAYLVYG